jgi:hypothetical protein
MNAFGGQIFKSFIYAIGILVFGVICLAVITPAQFMCGRRPAFISGWRKRSTIPAPHLFVDMSLPIIGSVRILPIIPLLMICVVWTIFNFRLDSMFTDFAAAWFVRVISCVGVLGGLALALLGYYKFESWRRIFLSYLKSRWNEKVCIILEVTD